mgnify:CR=1 FL=1
MRSLSLRRLTRQQHDAVALRTLAHLAPLTAGALTPGILYPVDVWIETATGNVLRVHITEPNANGWLIELFDIDVPVEISTP